MVDVLRIPEGREYARLPFEAGRSCAPSRRSSVSSRAESEASVFSDTSIASSQSSVSNYNISGWDSSTPYDSDGDSYAEASDIEFVSPLGEGNQAGINSDVKAARPSVTRHDSSNSVLLSDSHVLKNSVKRVATAPQPATFTNSNQKSDSGFVRPLHPSQIGQANLQSGTAPSNPRRTATYPGWSKPSLVTQDERRVNFVETLVDTATDLVALIWPSSVNPGFPDGQRNGTPVISLRFFIRETLRRSRTSFSTLQVAMYYLALLNSLGAVPKCNSTKEQRPDNPNIRALQCGRRMFLASLILASKYLQDRNYFTKAWSRISNLSVAEINKNEMALLSALDYKLHIKSADFQKWTDCISKCTIVVQQGFNCPWVDGLKAMKFWPEPSTGPVASKFSPSESFAAKRTLFPAELHGFTNCPFKAATRIATPSLPTHRIGLGHIGNSINYTRPICFGPRPADTNNSGLPWPGMASLLRSNVATQCATEIATGSDEPSALPPSPPKTPSPNSTEHRMRDAQFDSDYQTQNGDSSQPVPPPAPREPLVSLNTTPESNDGASTFGSYLSPLSNDSTQGSIPGNAHVPHLTQLYDARFNADTMSMNMRMSKQGTASNLSSLCSSPSGMSPELRPNESKSVKRLSAFKLEAESPIEPSMVADDDVVADDDEVAVANSDVEAETRRLTRMEIRGSAKYPTDKFTSCDVVDSIPESPNVTIPAADGTPTSGLKTGRSNKCTPCHRKKRGATSFSGGLAHRTKKAVRV